MHTNFYGPNKTEISSKDTIKFHQSMFNAFFWRPFAETFRGITDEIVFKIIIAVGGLPAIFALDLFATPRHWWQGLLYLVIIDWTSGIINAIYRGDFDWNVSVSKWYQVFAYVMVCGAAAVLSNGFNGVFYYFQFLVYATFFLKEFVSILQTFRLLATFRVAWRVWTNKPKGRDVHDMSDFVDAVEKSFERHTEPKKTFVDKYEGRVNDNNNDKDKEKADE